MRWHMRSPAIEIGSYWANSYCMRYSQVYCLVKLYQHCSSNATPSLLLHKEQQITRPLFCPHPCTRIPPYIISIAVPFLKDRTPRIGEVSWVCACEVRSIPSLWIRRAQDLSLHCCGLTNKCTFLQRLQNPAQGAES